MRIFKIFYLGLILLPACSRSYRKIHNDAIVVDGHNDILTQLVDSAFCFNRDLTGKTQSDLDRFIKAGIDVQIFSVWCDGNMESPFAYANRQIDTLYSWARHSPSRMMIIKTPSDIKTSITEHKLGAMIGVEGGHMIENSLDKLDSLYHLGARYMTLTWNNSTTWATSAIDETSDSLPEEELGLSELGKQVIKRMNELGMIVDISHVGEKTFRDAIETSVKPVIASHSCVYNICPHPRNLKDDQIRAIGKNGGVIMVTFVPNYLDSICDNRLKLFNAQHKVEQDSILRINPDEVALERYLAYMYRQELENINNVPVNVVVDHIDYIVKMIGIDHVGLGSDFDGMGDVSTGLEGHGVLDYPLITKALLGRGYSTAEIEKILGGNFIKVFTENNY